VNSQFADPLLPFVKNYFYSKLQLYFFSSVYSVQILVRMDKKVKNRRLPCPKCDIMYFQLKRDLTRAHTDEDDVQLAVSKGNNSHEMTKLINTGIFLHNVKVVSEKKGLFIPARGSDGRFVEDYVPCQYCLLMFVKAELYRHCRSCKLRCETINENRTLIADGKALFDGAVNAEAAEIPELLRMQVLYKMRLDGLTKTAKTDSLILHLGLALLNKLGPRRSNDIAQRMRQVARLCLKIKEKLNVESVKIGNYISGSGFDIIVDAIEDECGSYLDAGGRRLMKNPYIALKLG
jgi:hypothetical protein